MGFLDKFLGSDQNLRGPNIADSRFLELNFSDTKLRLKDPDHSALYPIDVFAEDMDLYEATEYKRFNEHELTKTFYKKGWELKGKMNIAKGGVDVIGSVSYFDNKMDMNQFQETTLKETINKYCRSEWHTNNIELKKNIRVSTINKTEWCHTEIEQKGVAPTTLYVTPLSPHHILIFEFSMGGYNDVDFYSPVTNLEQASHKLVEDFMNNFYIELSSEAKAQQSAAKDKIQTLWRTRPFNA